MTTIPFVGGLIGGLDFVLVPEYRAQRRAFDRQARIVSGLDPFTHFRDVGLDQRGDLRIVGFRDGPDAVGQIRDRTLDAIVVAEQSVDVAQLRHGRRIMAHAHHPGAHLHSSGTHAGVRFTAHVPHHSRTHAVRDPHRA